MIVWGLIGFVVGITFGLTGSGGALIAVPLFIHILGMKVHDATTSALFVVLVGALMSFVFQAKNSRPKVSMLIVAFGVASSSLFAMIKSETPPIVIQLLFASACAYSLYTAWIKKGFSEARKTEDLQTLTPKKLGLLALTGCGIGALVTMTGLGGGILITPTLLGALSMSPVNAVPTSLLAIVFNASGSMWAQKEAVVEAFNLANISFLAVGTIAGSVLTKRLIEKVPSETLGFYRKWIFTAVVSLSVFGVLLGR